MPAHEYRPGTPTWIELTSSDPRRVIPFYTTLFGWEAETPGDPDHDGYVTLTWRGQPVAGVTTQQDGNPYADVWTVYFGTDDAGATTEQAERAGGRVLLPATRVRDLGTLGFVADPAGAVFGLWQPARHTGFGYHGEIGAPVWFETLTRDYRAALGFYRAVLGWEYTVHSDTDEFRYSTATVGGDECVGILDAAALLPAGVPSSWQCYIAVADADAAVRAVPDLGGAVVEAPQDSPYGRVATVADPLGARLRIDELPAAG